MKTFTLSFDENQLNVIAQSLAKQPYEVVFQIIEELKKQIIKQQNAETEKTE